jgi:hypothetical protein
MRKEIDGSKNDIRVMCVALDNLPDDAGDVQDEGMPMDPPDDSPGWMLVNIWIEHDTVEEAEKAEKGEKPRVFTRKVDPRYYCLWVRPKSTKRAKKAKRTQAAAPATEPAPPAEAKPSGEPKKKRGRGSSTKKNNEATTNAGETADGPGGTLFGDDEAETEFAKCCEHHQQMLRDTVQHGEQRPITIEDVKAYAPNCYECNRDAEQAAGA